MSFAIIPPQVGFSLGPSDTQAGSLAINNGFWIKGAKAIPINTATGAIAALASEITITVYVARGAAVTSIGTIVTAGAAVIASNLTPTLLGQGDAVTLIASAAPGTSRNVAITLY